MAEIIDLPAPEKRTERGPMELPTQSRMREVAEMCGLGHFMSVVAGPPGIGKTEIWKQMRAADPRRVIIVTCTRSQNTMVRALKLVQETLCGYVDRYGAADDRARSIKEKLQLMQPLEAGEPGPLLIFDEAHVLEADALDVVRSIWDDDLGSRRGHACGIVWSGNPELAVTLSLTETPHFMEFKTRIRTRLHLKGPSRSDVLMFAAHLGVGDAAEQKFLCKVAEQRGALRAVENVVTHARLEADGARLSLNHLRDAAARVGMEISP